MAEPHQLHLAKIQSVCRSVNPDSVISPQSRSCVTITLSQVSPSVRDIVHPQSCYLVCVYSSFHPWLTPSSADSTCTTQCHCWSRTWTSDPLCVYFCCDEVRGWPTEILRSINKHNGALAHERKGGGRNALFKPVPLFFGPTLALSLPGFIPGIFRIFDFQLERNAAFRGCEWLRVKIEYIRLICYIVCLILRPMVKMSLVWVCLH